MRRQSTTDLEVIRKDPQLFTWGRITKIEDIGPYTLAHYIEAPMGNGPGGKRLIHLYVDGKSTNTSYTTLDGALVAGVAFRNCSNVNEGGWAATMAARVLKVKTD